MIAACIWLAIIVAYIYGVYKYDIYGLHKQKGAFRQFCIDFLGHFARKQFVESVHQDTGSAEIRYGFQLFGHRFFYFKVPLDKIESVSWGMGQDHRWSVDIWFDHDGAEDQKRQIWSHNFHEVGPSRRSEKKTEAFALALVDFLCRAGATLVQDEDFTKTWRNAKA